jgi:hypothetical protein
MLDTSAIADISSLAMMKNTLPLLNDIEAFLAETGMGPSYFGKQAVGNSELVQRLRDGKRVWPETEAKARAFMMYARKAKGIAA